MKRLLSLAAAFLTLAAINTIKAQNNTFRVDSIDFEKIEVQTSLSGEDLKEFEIEVINTVKQFNNNLSKLWSPRDAKSYSVQEFEDFRKAVKSQTLELFIGRGSDYFSEDTVAYRIEGNDNGKPYYIANNNKVYATNVRRDERGVLRAYVYDSVLHPGPVMEVTSTTRTNKIRKPMHRYVNNIMPKPGVLVKATFGGYKLMDKFQQVRPGVYEGSVSYYQEYRSFYGSENRKGYSDCTYKTMKVYIIFDEIVIGDVKYKKWNVLLGDVEATETKRL